LGVKAVHHPADMSKPSEIESMMAFASWIERPASMVCGSGVIIETMCGGGFIVFFV
jgi:hypothetical protein